jgi:hypothetical protein
MSRNFAIKRGLTMSYQFNPERLAYWYLRLNGFLTIENFIVHDETGGPQRTDIDLVALRLPHRREALISYGEDVRWMADDRRFAEKKTPFAAFVEVKSGPCELNRPWTAPEKDNMPRAIKAIGFFSTIKEVKSASKQIYTTGSYVSDNIELGIISIGDTENPELADRLPNVMQVRWSEVKDFIFERFRNFERVKREHPQWDFDGHLLWRVFQENRDKEAFASAIVLNAALPSPKEFDGYMASRRYPRR